MANMPDTIKLKWQALADSHVTLDSGFWGYWETHWISVFNRLRTLLDQPRGRPMEVSAVRALSLLIRDLTHYLDSIRQGGNKFVLDNNVRELIVHHIGNDLHRIFFIADISDSDPKPIAADDVEMIAGSVDEMASFWERLRTQTQG